MESKKQEYYYAANTRVPLERLNDYLAVDVDQLPQGGAKLANELRQNGTALRHGVFLARRSDITAELLPQLEHTSAERPVYQHENALIVVLPEVRVESSSEDKQQDVQSWAKKNESSAKLVTNRRGQMVIEPVSGCGEDALVLANQLHEELGVEMAQPRMLRIVKSPSVD